MSYMQRQVTFFAAWQVETTRGTEIVPQDVESDPDRLADYLEGEILGEIGAVSGFFCRLSAPGYMDCTEWSGPYKSAKEAERALTEMFGEDGAE